MKRHYLKQPTGVLRCVLCRQDYPDKQEFGKHCSPSRNRKRCKPL